MDYLPFDIIDGHDLWAEMNAIGAYDREAIENLYSSRVPQNYHRFCTDGDSYNYLFAILEGKVTPAKKPYCFSYDATSDNLSYAQKQMDELLQVTPNPDDEDNIVYFVNQAATIVPIAISYMRKSSSELEFSMAVGIFEVAFSNDFLTKSLAYSSDFADTVYSGWSQYLSAHVHKLDYCQLEKDKRDQVYKILVNFRRESVSPTIKSSIAESLNVLAACKEAFSSSGPE